VPDPSDQERLARLEERIDAAKKAQEPGPKVATQISQAHQAWRMIVELVVGIGIGVSIGYGFDVLFGTSPWLLVLFTLLGFAAGVNVMLKTAKELQNEAMKDTKVPGAGTDEGK
jgi:ATP synthase protein I